MASFDKTGTFLPVETGAHLSWIMFLLEAIQRAKEDLAAPPPEPPAPEQGVTTASSTEREASAYSLAPLSDGDPNWLGRQILERPGASVAAQLEQVFNFGVECGHGGCSLTWG